MKARADAAVDTAPDVHGSDVAVVADAAPETPVNAMSDAGTSALSDVSVGQDAATSLADSAIDAVTTMATITFLFKNTGTDTVYLHLGCTIPISVQSLADGAAYGGGGVCACDCSSPSCNGGLACGACAPDSGIPVAGGATQSILWRAIRTTTQFKTGPYGTFECVDQSPIPTGTYKVAINVYANESDAAARVNPHTIELTFLLGTADATVEVPIS